MRPFEVPLGSLQPSQLWVSAAKLAAIPPFAACEPVPVWRLGGCLVITDGHTRALAAHRAGRRTVPAVWETEDLDREAYKTCVRWCRDEGVRSVADLEGRVIPPAEYEARWRLRCRAMHESLAREREERAAVARREAAQVRIDPAAREDVPDIVGIQREIETEEALFGYRADPKEAWAGRDLRFAYVARVAGRLAGFVHAEPRPFEGECVFPAGSRVLEITELLVARTDRDRGIGSALVETARHRAVDEGYTHLRVYSAARRFDDALRFYRTAGFRPWYLELTQELAGHPAPPPTGRTP